MSDKRNDNNKHDDINEFFAQFDQATVDQNRRKQSDRDVCKRQPLLFSVPMAPKAAPPL